MSEFSIERAILAAIKERTEEIAGEEIAKAQEAISRRVRGQIDHIVLAVQKNYEMTRDGGTLIIRVISPLAPKG